MITPGVELFKILVAAAESRSLEEAAGKLALSQPAVSMKLQQLELLSPIPVFRYEGKRKVLTQYGRELYQMARAQQESLDQAFESLNRRFASPRALTLKVGGRKELFEILTPKFRFEGKIEFLSFTSAEAVEQLQEQKVDIALCYEPLIPNSSELTARKVFESVSEFVVHRKWIPKGVPLENLLRDHQFLTGTPCVAYQGGGHSLSEWVKHLGLEFSALHVAGVAEDWRIVKTMIEDGWGYGVVPAHIKSYSKEIVSCPMPSAVLPKFKFYALFHRDLMKVPAFKKLLTFRS